MLTGVTCTTGCSVILRTSGLISAHSMPNASPAAATAAANITFFILFFLSLFGGRGATALPVFHLGRRNTKFALFYRGKVKRKRNNKAPLITQVNRNEIVKAIILDMIEL